MPNFQQNRILHNQDLTHIAKKIKIEYRGKFIWTIPDLPPDERFPRAIVFVGRKLCTEWGYQWNQIYVDEANPLKPILKTDGGDIITAPC